MQEIIADQPFIVVDRRSDEDVAEIGIEIDRLRAGLRPPQIRRTHVRRIARQLEVFEKARLVVDAAAAVEFEPLKEDVPLERVEGRAEVFGVSPEPVEPRLVLRGIDLHIDIRAGKKLAQPGVDECLILEQRRDALREFIELLGQEQLVDGVFSEAPALFHAQFRRDEIDEPGQIGMRQPGEKGPALGGVEIGLGTNEIVERFIGKLAEPIAVLAERLRLECLTADAVRIERRRQIRLLITGLLLVIELQIEPLLEEVDRRLGIGIVREKRVPIFNDAALLGIRKPRLPLIHHGLELLLLGGVLILERVVKIIFLAARNEFAEDLLAIRRESKFLDKPDFIICPESGPAGEEKKSEKGGNEPRFHGKWKDGKMRP